MLVALFLATASGCGGGGDGGTATASGTSGGGASSGNTATPTTPTTSTPTTSTPTPDVPAPVTPKLSVSIAPATIAMQGDTGQLQGTTTAQVSVANPPASGYYYRASWAGNALQSVTSLMSSAAEGIITLTSYAPRSLGAGTYTSTVTFTLCADSQCAQLLAGGSVTVPVTYTVTGSAKPLTQLQILPNATQFAAQSADATGPLVSLAMSVVDLPPTGLRLFFSEQGTSRGAHLISSLDFKQTSSSTAELKVQFTSPSALALGAYSTTLNVRFCFDAACSQIVDGSPISIPLTLNVLGTEGRDFTKKILARNVADAAWDPVSRRIYAATSTDSGGQLVAIDPSSGATGPSIALPGLPTHIALSDDGQFAYVGFATGIPIQRYRLPDLAPDIAISFGDMATVYRLAVAPGMPHTLAVALQGPSKPFSIAIYDDAVPRPLKEPASFPSFEYVLAWGNDATTLFGMTTQVHRYAVTPDGLTPTSVSPSIGQPLGSMFAGGRLYFGDGQVFDTAAQTQVGKFDAPCCINGIAVKAGSNRAYLFTGSYWPVTIASILSLSTLASVGVPTLDATPGLFIAWGNNGVAYRNGNSDLIALSGSFFEL